MDIIQYLLSIIKTLYQQNCWLLTFICRYIPLKQWAFDDSHSPKYEKFKTDPLLKIIPIRHEDWKHLCLEYKRSHNGRELKSISRRADVKVPVDLRCPCCGAPFQYLYRNNGSKGQHQCKVCGELFPGAKQDLLKIPDQMSLLRSFPDPDKETESLTTSCIIFIGNSTLTSSACLYVVN